jgi:hypothetical protein
MNKYIVVGAVCVVGLAIVGGCIWLKREIDDLTMEPDTKTNDLLEAHNAMVKEMDLMLDDLVEFQKELRA